jgi:hypothetical protein
MQTSNHRFIYSIFLFTVVYIVFKDFVKLRAFFNWRTPPGMNRVDASWRVTLVAHRFVSWVDNQTADRNSTLATRAISQPSGSQLSAGGDFFVNEI